LMGDGHLEAGGDAKDGELVQVKSGLADTARVDRLKRFKTENETSPAC